MHGTLTFIFLVAMMKRSLQAKFCTAYEASFCGFFVKSLTYSSHVRLSRSPERFGYVLPREGDDDNATEDIDHVGK